MKVGGQIPWNVIPICETSQIYYLMGRRPMQDVLCNHLNDRLFHLVHWLSISLSLRKTSQESVNLERKSFLDCSLDTLCTREEFGRVTQMVADIEETQKRKNHCSSRRWTSQNFRRRSGSENIHLDTASTNSGEKSP